MILDFMLNKTGIKPKIVKLKPASLGWLSFNIQVFLK